MTRSRGKEIIPKVIIMACSVFLLFLILEIAIRVRHKVITKTPFFMNIYYFQWDSVLGWKGKKIWGDPASGKLKILFVGDSFTTSDWAPGHTYFDTVKNELGIEAFVFGGDGYGNLQEYLAIDRYIDMIHPDLVVLQVCSNDFINNLWELERRSYLHSNYQERPYYENGRINYHFSSRPVFLRKRILPYSRLVGSVVHKIDMILAALAKKGHLKTVEAEIEEKGLDFALFRKSVGVTSRLIGKIQERCGRIPVIAFTTFDDEPYFSQFKKIFKGRGIYFIEEIPRLAWEAEVRGGEIKRKNYLHWGKEGHIACGKHLADYIHAYLLRNKPDRSLDPYSIVENEK